MTSSVRFERYGNIHQGKIAGGLIYPICDGDLDSIKGIVSVKDLYVSDDFTKFKHLMKPALLYRRIICLPGNGKFRNGKFVPL
jgi:hypothetical protein